MFLNYEFLKALYFGGSAWSISWLHYVLGPMKCSGKQQLYPSEYDQLKEQKNEQKIFDVINKAKSKGIIIIKTSMTHSM